MGWLQYGHRSLPPREVQLAIAAVATATIDSPVLLTIPHPQQEWLFPTICLLLLALMLYPFLAQSFTLLQYLLLSN